MSELVRIQSDFQDFVIAGGEVANQHIVGSATASVADRLDVYFQAYRLRLAEVLEIDYRGLRSLVDGPQFESIVANYIDAFPSSNPSVRWVGHGLARFLANTPPYDRQPVLAEMADFEWARGKAFDGPDREVISTDALDDLPGESWPALSFEFHPTVNFLSLRFNVPAIWHAVSADDVAPAPESGEVQDWIVWRRNLIVHWRSISAAEAAALKFANAGNNFGELCAELCQWFDEAEVPVQAVSYLKQWLADDLIVRIETGA